jgi:hypothetical protein
MAWTIQDNKGVSTFESSSIATHDIVADLKTVLDDTKNKLLDFKDVAIKEILIYIDGTNGYVFCSGFDSKNELVFDDLGSSLKLIDFYDFCDSPEGGKAMEFDIVIIDCVNRLIDSDFGKVIYEKFDVFVQDELEPPKKIINAENKAISFWENIKAKIQSLIKN